MKQWGTPSGPDVKLAVLQNHWQFFANLCYAELVESIGRPGVRARFLYGAQSRRACRAPASVSFATIGCSLMSFISVQHRMELKVLSAADSTLYAEDAPGGQRESARGQCARGKR